MILSVICVCLGSCKKSSDAAADGASGSTVPQGSMTDEYLSLMNVGKAQYDAGDAASAVASFRSAVDLFPTEPVARLNLARAQIRSGEFTHALTNADFVLERDRHNTAAQYLAGLALLRSGQPKLAAARFEEATKQDPANDVLHFQLALALKDSNRNARYLEELNTVISLNTNAWSAYYRLAQESMAANDLDRAEEFMDRFREASAEIAAEEKTQEALEQTVYTEIELPESVFQPELEGVPVRFILVTELGQSDGVYPTFSRVAAGNETTEWYSINRSASSIIPLYVPPGGSGITMDVADRPFDLVGFVTTRVADFDNDGLEDVFAFNTNGLGLLHQISTNQFRYSRQGVGITSRGATDAVWVDYDHDADVDLLVAEPEGRLVLWQNNGERSFTDESELAGIPEIDSPVTQLTVADYDGDESIDVVVSEASGSTWLLRNDGLGMFEKQTRGWVPGDRHAVEDFDNDLKRDIVIASGTKLNVSLTGGNGFELDVASGGIRQLRTIDYDNDGWLDLLVLTGGAESHALRLFRNTGSTQWVDVTEETGLDQLAIGGQGISVADFDFDGDSDLLINRPDGRLVMLSNEGGNANRQLKLFLTGTKSNRSGIGTLVEIRSGGVRMSRMISELPVEIGIGELTELDSLRTIWPNGIVKNDVWVSTDEPLKIEEPFVSAGSCPYLYVWNGNEFEFITDILGNAPIGLSMQRGQYIPADTSEYLWLGDDQKVAAKDGEYLVQITDELRELLYLDHAKLTVVDHPPETEVHSTDKLEPPPFSEAKLVLLKNRKGLVRAVDHTGNNVTELLNRVDGYRTRPPELLKPQLRGQTHPFFYTMEFADLDASKPLVLALTGWLMWGDASVNVAMGQGGGGNPFPYLEAEVNGEWQRVDVTAGAPAGKTKTILIELDGKLPAGTTRLRWGAALEIYWDRIALFEKADFTQMVQREIAVEDAELFWRGFGKQTRSAPTSPITPDSSNISPYAPWATTLWGNCTRYGDVTRLLNAVDDRYVILNGGDAVVLHFPDDLPAKNAAAQRTFFLFVDGWDKDSDYNVKFGDRVEPLPFHGMDPQKYGEETWRPDTAWIEEYNTRWVNP